MASSSQSWRPGLIWPDVCQRLHTFYSEMLRHFGFHPRWWPGPPWEITLSAILVQQCDWTVAHQGVRRLIENGIHSIAELADADAVFVQNQIRSVSFAPTKSARLITFAQRLRDRKFKRIEDYLSSAPTDVLRNDLLTMPGIGDETADAILLYAGEMHPTFIFDTYTRRILSRARLSPSLDERFWKQLAAVLRRFLQDHLLANVNDYENFDWGSDVSREVALMRDYHAQLVELGRHHCTKSKPRCHTTGKHGWTDHVICRDHCTVTTCTACPLSDLCQHAQGAK